MRWLLVVLVGCGDNLRPAILDAPEIRTDAPADATPDAETRADADVDAPIDALPPDAPSSVVVVPCASFVALVETSSASYTLTSISIHVGDVIRFAPSSPHDARSGTPAAPQDLFTVDGGAPRCLRFDEAGAVPFYCQVHPTMTGTITVAP